MSSIRNFVRPLAVAITLAIAAAPASAFAESGRAAPAETKEAKRKGRHFPVDAQKFEQIVDKRITKAREHMERAMESHHVPDALKTQIRKDFDDGAAAVKAAAKRVGADGTVTREEAKEVKDLAKSIKQKAREKYGAGGKKNKKADA